MYTVYTVYARMPAKVSRLGILAGFLAFNVGYNNMFSKICTCMCRYMCTHTIMYAHVIKKQRGVMCAWLNLPNFLEPALLKLEWDLPPS